MDFVGDYAVLRCQKFGTPALFLVNKGHVWENKISWTLSPSGSQVHPPLKPTNAPLSPRESRKVFGMTQTNPGPCFSPSLLLCYSQAGCPCAQLGNTLDTWSLLFHKAAWVF